MGRAVPTSRRTCTLTMSVDFASDLEQAIYRVIQEALSNVSRHSRATHVEVELSYKEDNRGCDRG